MLMLAIGLLYLTRIQPDSGYWVSLFPGLFVIGIGLGFSFVPISIAALAGVQPTDAGLASGLINTSQQIGGALGVAVLTTIANNVTGTYDPRNPTADLPQRLTDGFAAGFWASAGFAVISLIVVLTVLRGPELSGAGREGAAAHVG